MTIQAGLYAYLASIAAITGEVGTRIYPDAAPSSAKSPYVVVQKISADRDHHLTGASGMVTARFQITAWASNSVTRVTVIEAIRQNLDTYRGTMGGVVVRNVHIENETQGFMPAQGKDQQHDYYARADFIIWHLETVPSV